MRIVDVDFETHGIETRPNYPPKPVGVAIYDGPKAIYHSWGHPEGNTITEAAGKRLVKDLWKDKDAILRFHSMGFDLEVAFGWCGVAPPPAERLRCTEIEAFLCNPYFPRLSLKPLSEDVLDMPPDERDELRDWILTHVPSATKKTWGAHISKAPVRLVAPYAIGDIKRTRGLGNYFSKDFAKHPALVKAYLRERRLMTEVILPMERLGVPLHQERAAKMAVQATKSFEAMDAWIRKRLKSKDLEIDKRADVADALERTGLVKEWVATPTGKRSLAAGALEEVIEDPVFASVYVFRNKWATWLRTFILPWSQSGDRIYPQWNATRVANERQLGRQMGARTGRLASTPNIQNVPVRKPLIVSSMNELKAAHAQGSEAFYLPDGLRQKVGEVPNIRSLVCAPKGTVLIDADYNQQELRGLAHYEAGGLRDAYRKDPKLDVHELAQKRINAQLGTTLERKQIKPVGFGIIYGIGKDKLAGMLGIEPELAATIKKAYTESFSGLPGLLRRLRETGDRNQPIWTWGGRRYYPEPDKIIDGVVRSFGYKLLNTLVQGSCADCTKEAMIRYNESGGTGLIFSVHDEIGAWVPAELEDKSVKLLRKAMESVEFDPKMIADIKTGPDWSACSPVEK